MTKNKKSFNGEIPPASTQHQKVQVDVGFPGFMAGLEELGAEDQERVLVVIEKIQKMTWDDIYRTSSKSSGQKRGLNFEPLDQSTKSGMRVASIRITQKMRARVYRRDQWLIFISIHPDHDSAYKAKGGEDV